MATRTLADKIESLPPAKRAAVEEFVDSLAQHGHASSSPGLVERLRARRQRLLREHGVFDSLPIIRDLREHGPR